jgi:hypothetical protein
VAVGTTWSVDVGVAPARVATVRVRSAAMPRSAPIRRQGFVMSAEGREALVVLTDNLLSGW